MWQLITFIALSLLLGVASAFLTASAPSSNQEYRRIAFVYGWIIAVVVSAFITLILGGVVGLLP
jgi:hypothetical protein